MKSSAQKARALFHFCSAFPHTLLHLPQAITQLEYFATLTELHG